MRKPKAVYAICVTSAELKAIKDARFKPTILNCMYNSDTKSMEYLVEIRQGMFVSESNFYTRIENFIDELRGGN